VNFQDLKATTSIKQQLETSAISQKRKNAMNRCDTYLPSSPSNKSYSIGTAGRRSSESIVATNARKFGNTISKTPSTSKASRRTSDSIAVRRPSEKSQRMFESLHDSISEITILDSHEDDILAASMFGGAKQPSDDKNKKTTAKKRPELKKGISGYNFDKLIKEEEERAASAYSIVDIESNKKKKSRPKLEKATSGYNFDKLIKDYDDSSSTFAGHDSLRSARRE